MDPLFAAAIFVFGLAFGSFLNVCIHRLPRRIETQDQAERARIGLAKLQAEGAPEEQVAAASAEADRLARAAAGYSVVHPKSACPKCHEPIRPYDNIPLVSWIVLRGRCRFCGNPISPRYITVELITGLLFLACYWRFGLNLATVKFCIFSFLIVGLTFIDAEWKLLPDVFTIPGLVIGLVFSQIVPLYDWFVLMLLGAFPQHAFSGRLMSLSESVVGAGVGAAFFFFIALAYRYARGREGMGMGDVKLMAMIGAFLGARLTVLTILGASVIGSAFGVAMIVTVWNRRTERRMSKCREPRPLARKRAWRSAKLIYGHYGIPFGVFLGPMALLAAFFGRSLLAWYWGLF